MPDYEHFHLGYYKDGHDIEAIGFRNNEGTYDVFFDDFQDKGLFDNSFVRHDVYGVLLFKVKDEYKGFYKFQKWVENELLPFRRRRMNRV
ncbi:DUF3986 family protein [Ammoniphilus sp. 3BR4]|uniref:DUF3986 family protein n=1 Tax=Ammoniphilus sp. 3BR4 TaxID=3158265 RepID=UPI003466EF57